MPRFYCDYCDIFLKADGYAGRKQHQHGRKHQDNLRQYYMQFLRTAVLQKPQARAGIKPLGAIPVGGIKPLPIGATGCVPVIPMRQNKMPIPVMTNLRGRGGMIAGRGGMMPMRGRGGVIPMPFNNNRGGSFRGGRGRGFRGGNRGGFHNNTRGGGRGGYQPQQQQRGRGRGGFRGGMRGGFRGRMQQQQQPSPSPMAANAGQPSKFQDQVANYRQRKSHGYSSRQQKNKVKVEV